MSSSVRNIALTTGQVKDPVGLEMPQNYLPDKEKRCAEEESIRHQPQLLSKFPPGLDSNFLALYGKWSL